ncbi:MAG: carbamate kinase [Cyanobacteriota bacterium]
MGKKLAVIAIGGNSLITDTKNISIFSQYKAASDTCKHIVDLITKGYKVIITHGNGPQVGFILRRAELSQNELHMLPLDTCGANTQGEIGYQIQKAMYNAFQWRGMDPLPVVTLVTQTVVDKADPSFKCPTKPIGTFMDKNTALAHQAKDGWSVTEDAGRGWRRVVPSPLPVKILELPAIKKLLEDDIVIVTVGGGGIPVVEQEGKIWGAEAVIDKDFATCLLAKELKADLFLISTAIEQVYLNFKKENACAISQMTIAEAEQYVNEGHFAKGSMLPKINACIDFVQTTGNKAIITSPQNILQAVDGEAGTTIIP